MELLLHPETKKRLAALKHDLPHAILLSGKPGIGLATIARHLGSSRLADFIEPADTKGEINHDTGTISVATIRRLYEQTRGKHLKPQIFILDDADKMSRGAQAAFLKLLEEPTVNTHFILTSHSPQVLLPTVRSRVQSINVDPVSSRQTNTFISNLGITDPTKKRQLEYLGQGLPAELLRLSADDSYFEARAEIMSDTRNFLSGSAFQKIVIIHKYHHSKQKALQLLDGALTVSERSLHAKPQASLVEQLQRLLVSREKIAANCNVRLQLLALVL